MRILITWGSKHGGTEGIGQILGEQLRKCGFEVVAIPAQAVTRIDIFDAVIIGGALYANRWPSNVRHFIHQHTAQLRRVPVWLFSSGPLDDSAEHQDIAATNQVNILAERIGAKGHITFGGRLDPEVKGFPESAMAKTKHGDWRNPEHIRAWAKELAEELPYAKPGTPVEHPAYALWRLFAYSIAGWALCAGVTGALFSIAGLGAALVARALSAPFVFAVLAWYYFREPGPREALPTAITWVVTVALLDLMFVAGLTQRSLAIFTNLWGTWLPFALIFFVTWATGAIVSTMPWPKNTAKI